MQEYKNESMYFKFGYEIFGPFLLGFTKWLSAQISENPVDTLLFLSRDGYMMHRAYDCLDNTVQDRKDFYCSRKSLRTALLWKYDTYEKMLQLINKVKVVSVADMLGFWGFDSKDTKMIAKRYDVKLDFFVPFEELNNNALFKQMYDDNVEIINRYSKEQNDLLLGYIKNNVVGKTCGLVDIGWHGSMQYYLENFADLNGLEIEFVGFYVGIASFYELNGNAFGFLFQNQDDDLRRKVLCSHGLLEKLFQSKEGSTIGYGLINNCIEAQKSEFEYENDMIVQNCIDGWQDGAMSYIAEKKNINIDKDDCVFYAKKYISYGMNPKLRDIKVFQFLYNVEARKNYYIATKPIYKYGLKELWLALNSSPWKTGFLKSLFKIPLPYYLIYRMVSK